MWDERIGFAWMNEWANKKEMNEMGMIAVEYVLYSCNLLSIALTVLLVAQDSFLPPGIFPYRMLHREYT